MAAKIFSPVYVARVLDPAYRNWKERFYGASMAVHKAHLCMLHETKIVPHEIVSRIAQGIARLEKVFSPPEHIPEGVEDLYFLFEKALGEQIGEEEAAWLHTARSRNDMDTTVFRLVLRESFFGLLERLLGLAGALRTRCAQSGDELTVLFTHGQPANPSTTEHYLSSFLMEILEDTGVLLRALRDVDRSSMGACAITGSGFPIDRERVARLLGFDGYIVNTYQAISTSHWLVGAASSLQTLMVDTGRFVADLLHKASSEVGLYQFPDELVQVSSIMPQKRNPVVLEHIRIQAEMIAGECQGAVRSFQNVPYQDVNENADMVITRMLETIEESLSVLDLLEEALLKMRADTGRARDICARFGVTTTELADSLVRTYGIGFRKAHHICSEFVAAGQDKTRLRAVFHEETGLELDMSDGDIEALLAPETFIRVRRTAGGPAPEGMRAVYNTAQEVLEGMKRELENYTTRWTKARATLEAGFNELLSK
jgi:argininosuccinate lyase